MVKGNKSYKQILIDSDNYNSLKNLGQTGDSFNSVIYRLVKNFNEWEVTNWMSEIQDVIIRDSDKQFRLRINGFLRSRGVSQIVGTKEYLEIQFIGGEDGIRIVYPTNLEDLHKSIKQELIAETQLSLIEIDNIRFYISDYIEEIEEALNTTS